MATEKVRHACHQAEIWAQEALQAGWLTEKEVDPLARLDTRTPGELFEENVQRPLVVAFFGGTGVGKSSLLNRLAGQSIARTGVERPTSREVTIYLHNTIRIQNLPEEFPVEKVKIALHQQPDYKEVLWIDMPDIDSVDTGNRELVLEWLPHIDVLIYVVSPERYRDDRGWRLLLQHGHRHAWLFVINQWDRGQPSQREDFLRLLGEAGFQDPIVLCTDSRKNQQTSDDFDQLAQTIRSLANAHTIEQLEARGELLRLQELHRTVAEARERLGPDESFPTLQQQWQKIWETTTAELQRGLTWKLEKMAENFASHEPGMLQQIRGAAPQQPIRQPDVDTGELLDQWALTRLDDALDNLVIEAAALALPTTPLRRELDEIRNNAAKWLQDRLQGSLRSALLKPGTALQRFLYGATGLLAALLPLLALGWVGYRVFVGYYHSALAPGQYLGINFATHSILLVVTSWLLPWLLHRKLKPSLKLAALRGLQTGLESGLAEIGHRTREVIGKLHRQQQELRQKANQVLQRTPETEAGDRNTPDNQTLLRMLMDKPADTAA